MSVGRRWEKHGYGFLWPPYSDKPFYIKPDSDFDMSVSRRDSIYLQSFEFVPYLADYRNTESVPKVPTANSYSVPGRAVEVEDAG